MSDFQFWGLVVYGVFGVLIFSGLIAMPDPPGKKPLPQAGIAGACLGLAAAWPFVATGLLCLAITACAMFFCAVPATFFFDKSKDA